MKILVCGDRNYKDKQTIDMVLSGCYEEFDDFVLIEGGAKGADFYAARWSEMYDGVELIEVEANWDKYGKAAGPIRNREMADLGPDLVIAFHDNIEDSKGTKDMVSVARDRGIKVLIISQ